MSLQNLQPHPMTLPPHYTDPTTAVIFSDEQWLRAAGYIDMEGFMGYYDFEDPRDRRDAERFLKSFRNDSAQKHPGLLSVYDGEPAILSEEQWLRQAGYKDFRSFAEWYGLQDDPARKLLMAFRDNHQTAWAIKDSEIEHKPENEKKNWELEVENNHRSGGLAMNRAQISVAVQWHEKQGHLGYDDLKVLAQEGVIHGMPEFLKTMYIGHIPVCEQCKAAGMKDR